MIEVHQFETDEGTCPFADWFDTLPAEAAVRVDRALQRIRLGNLGDHKGVGEGVTERRIDFGPGYRVYFGRDGDRVVILLAGGTKKRQSSDIRAAQRLWKDYKQRKRSTRPWH